MRKMHLNLPGVFALRLNTAIFACFAGKKRKFRTVKSLPPAFCAGGVSNAKNAFESTRRFYFAAEHRNFCLLCRQKTQIPHGKKVYHRLFFAVAARMTRLRFFSKPRCIFGCVVL
ncbi:MAG: hypothetical protein IJW40_10715 [Clostridia bacterium]|nr:hypothetical protein [Clostridia bacterium]